MRRVLAGVALHGTLLAAPACAHRSASAPAAVEPVVVQRAPADSRAEMLPRAAIEVVWSRAIPEFTVRGLASDAQGRIYVAGVTPRPPPAAAPAAVLVLEPDARGVARTDLGLVDVAALGVGTTGAITAVGVPARAWSPPRGAQRAVLNANRAVRLTTGALAPVYASAPSLVRVAAGPRGEVCLALSGDEDVDVGAPEGRTHAPSGEGIFVAQWDGAGALRAGTWVTPRAASWGYALAVNAAGRCVVAGGVRGAVTCGGAEVRADNNDLFVAEVDAQGATPRCWLFGEHPAQPNADGDQTATGISVDECGRYRVVGYGGGAMDFGQFRVASAGVRNPVAAVIDPSAGVLWAGVVALPGDALAQGMSGVSRGGMLLAHVPGVGLVAMGAPHRLVVLPSSAVAVDGATLEFVARPGGELLVAGGGLVPAAQQSAPPGSSTLALLRVRDASDPAACAPTRAPTAVIAP